MGYSPNQFEEELREYMEGNMKIQNVYWEITNVCNLNCKHCYNSSTCNNSYFCQEEKAREIIDGLAVLGCKSISLSGGEPFLHPQLDILVERALKNGLKVILITNGTLLTQEFVNRYARENVLYQISIESSVEAENDYIRGKGVYKKIQNAINLLRENGLVQKVYLHQTPNELNYRHIEDLIVHSKRSGCAGIGFSQWSPLGRSVTYADEMAMQDKEVMDLFETIGNCRLVYNDEHFEVSEAGVVQECKLANLQDGEEISPYISNSGHVYCCSGFHDPIYAIGNINENSIECILGTNQRIKEVVQYVLKNMKSCKTCLVKNVCKRGCFALATAKNMEDDGFCGIRKKMMVNLLRESV